MSQFSIFFGKKLAFGNIKSCSLFVKKSFCVLIFWNPLFVEKTKFNSVWNIFFKRFSTLLIERNAERHDGMVRNSLWMCASWYFNFLRWLVVFHLIINITFTTDILRHAMIPNGVFVLNISIIIFFGTIWFDHFYNDAFSNVFFYKLFLWSSFYPKTRIK